MFRKFDRWLDKVYCKACDSELCGHIARGTGVALAILSGVVYVGGAIP